LEDICSAATHPSKAAVDISQHRVSDGVGSSGMRLPARAMQRIAPTTGYRMVDRALPS
jgi:hypothetical protein